MSDMHTTTDTGPHTHSCRDCDNGYECHGRLDATDACHDFDGSCPDCHAAEG